MNILATFYNIQLSDLVVQTIIFVSYSLSCMVYKVVCTDDAFSVYNETVKSPGGGNQYKKNT